MTSPTTDPVRITWESGLCRCGCRGRVTRPENQFLNGHGGKLLDVLVDAHRAGRQVKVAHEEVSGLGVMSPREWAAQSFTPRGLAYFDWLVAHEEGRKPTKAEIDAVLAELPDDSVEELLTSDRGEAEAAAAIRAGGAEPVTDVHLAVESRSVRAARDGSLEADLALVRDIVSRAAVAGDGDPAAVSRLEERIARLQDTVSEQGRLLLARQLEHEAALDEVEREAAAVVDRLERERDRVEQERDGAEARARELAAELLTVSSQLDEATAPVTVLAEDLSSLSAPMVLAAARQRVHATAAVLKRARFDGDADEVTDLAQVFRGDFIRPERVAAARVFLGSAE